MSLKLYLTDQQRRDLNFTVRVRLEALAEDGTAATSTDIAGALDSSSAVMRGWVGLLDGLAVISENANLSARGQLEQAERLITERTTRAQGDINTARQRLGAAEREAQQTIERATAEPLGDALAGLGVQIRDRLAGEDISVLRQRVRADRITARAVLSAPPWLLDLDEGKQTILRDAAAEAHAPGAYGRLKLIERFRESLAGLETSWTRASADVLEQFRRLLAAEAQELRQRGQPVDERGRPRRRAAAAG